MELFPDVLNGAFTGFYMIDIFVFPVYAYVIYHFFNNYAKKIKDPIAAQYFKWGFQIKMICAILFWAIFTFYYKGGDTFICYWHAIYLKTLLFRDPSVTFNLIFNTNSFYTRAFLLPNLPDGGSYITDGATFIIIVIGFVISVLAFSSYITTCLVFSMIAFWGTWKLFSMFYEMYPHLHRQMAIACLFIPSVCFWGAGYLKDPVCIGFLGIFSYSIYEGIIKRRNVLKNILWIAFSAYVIFSIKVYIILSFAPAAGLWVFARYRYTIKSPFIKAVIGPVMLVLGGGLGVLILTQIASVAEKYSFESMMRTSQDTQNWLITSSKMSDGSFYTLGDIEYSLAGMIKIFPMAVNVALCRPYLWEARKPILYLSSLEGLITLYFTVRQLLKAGFFGTFKQIAGNPEVQFCLIFSIIFAFAVGFTSFNFGALARYKIPFMPFYYIALFILSDTQKNTDPVKV
jgi:hypothetical protein